MISLLNRMADRALRAVLPEVEASACTVIVGYCYGPVRQRCYSGSMCVEWYQCATNAGAAYCRVVQPGGQVSTYPGCC